MRRTVFLLVTVLTAAAVGVAAHWIGGIIGSVDIRELDDLSVVLAGVFVTWVAWLAARPERRPVRVREPWRRLGRQ